MSLVVLRSWSDGKPPTVRAIAPPDSDKDEVVVPDNKGHFVTTEVDKSKEVTVRPKPNNTPVPRPRSCLLPPLVAVNTSPASSSPSPPIPEQRKHWKVQTLPHDMRTIEAHPQMSRESSVNSGSTDSPPLSPVCGSRYKSLGPELAATIPRRMIIRETWVKAGQSQFKKQKELSKSTPDLLSHDDLAKQEPLSTQRQPVPRRTRTLNQIVPPRPLSYIDIFYGSDGEPQFGDRPASVVQVFKKDTTAKNPWLADQNLQKRNSLNLESQPGPPLQLAEKNFCIEPRSYPVPAKRILSVRQDSAPSSTSSEVSKQVFRSELKVPLRSTSIEFPVHKVVHPSCTPEPHITEIKLHSEKAEADENEEIDAELEALREESSRSTASTLEVDTLQADSPPGIIPVQSDSSDMSTTCSSSASSPQFFFKDTRRKLSQTSEKELKKSNGSAWAQVPVQCVNRHVFLPQETLTREPERMKNGHWHTNYKTNQQRRKNFCDELLNNDVIIQVPSSVQSRLPPPNSPPVPPQALNHDGIVIFDEEEEDTLHSDTGSVATSETEKSVDYISVFHNVQVKDGSRLSHSPKMPEISRIVGLDLGSLTTRYATLDKASGTLRIGPTNWSLTSADGLKHGVEAMSHALTTKSRLVYKWKRKQSFPYDPYDSEDCGSTLETLLREYRHILGHSERCSENQKLSRTTQWNLTIHGGMDKKLVREAALSSGLVKSTDELRLVNESTAAAATAWEFLQDQMHPWGQTFLSVNIGSTFIHTSGYEQRGKKLVMIESSDSQLYESPESHFVELFSRLFGRDFILKFESSFQPSWIEMLIRFDELKETFSKTQTECYMFLPISFYLEYKRFTGIELPECLEDNIDEGVRWDKNGTVRFNLELLFDWFQPIVNFVKTRLKIKAYDTLVLSGGGTNNYIATELKRLLPFVNVYNLPEANTAVVEGLVKLDNAQMVIKCPFSLGVGVMTPFDETAHPHEKAVTRQGKKWCSDVWDTLIRKGQPMTIGQPILRRSYVGAQPGQNILVLPLFKSDLEDPKLVTCPSVEKCCELRFVTKNDKAWREVQLVIRCYDSELIIVATGNDGGINRVVIDF